MEKKQMIDSNNQFNRLTRSLIEATRNVMEKKTNKHGHDAVGHEDEDINNDGKNDGTDKYLHNRRKAIASSMKKEEVEAIDELSKKTLGSYIKKASGAEQPKNVMSPKNVPLTKIAAYQGDSETGYFGKRFNQATYDKAERLRKNRQTGITRAADKLTKEEAQIDELSEPTVRNYYNKAGEQGKKIADKMKIGGGDWSKDGSDTKTLKKRAAGRDMALKRRRGEMKMSEEAEAIDEALDAAARYGQHHTAIKELMKSIDHHVRMHRDDAHKHKDYRGKKGVHWGHVGDLAQVHSQLADIHDRLAQQGEYKKTMGESVEDYDLDQIDELSQKTLGSYVGKAADDFQKRKPKMGYDGQLKKMQNRKVGVNRALDKMYGEDVELDEAPVDGVAAGSMNNDGHLCATKVFHKEWAEGTPIFSQHAEPDADGNIAWYDVMFEHGIEKGVSIDDLDVLMAESHERHSKRKMKEETSKLDEQTKAALASFVKEARGRPRKNPLPTGQSDEPEPRQHIMQQLQRAKLSMRGGEHVTFKDGTKHHVAGQHAEKILAKYSAMKPAGKEEFQKKISASHAAFKAEL